MTIGESPLWAYITVTHIRMNSHLEESKENKAGDIATA